jgi:hypothetical protein
MSTGRVGGQGPQFRPTTPQPTVRKKGAKETKDTKEAKSTEAKGGVRSQAKAGGVKGKAKAKGKDLGVVGGLLAGQDNWALEDEEQDRKRKSRKFFEEQEIGDPAAVPEDWDPELSRLQNIAAEFRGQVAQGLAAARSFTRGSVSNRSDEDEGEVDDDG